jgi:hypothetical protein
MTEPSPVRPDHDGPRPFCPAVGEVPLSVWATAQRDARAQRAGRYPPAATAHPGKMLPAIAATAITRPHRPHRPLRCRHPPPRRPALPHRHRPDPRPDPHPAPHPGPAHPDHQRRNRRTPPRPHPRPKPRLPAHRTPARPAPRHPTTTPPTQTPRTQVIGSGCPRCLERSHRRPQQDSNLRTRLRRTCLHRALTCANVLDANCLGAYGGGMMSWLLRPDEGSRPRSRRRRGRFGQSQGETVTVIVTADIGPLLFPACGVIDVG